jgi:hypothetical protein
MYQGRCRRLLGCMRTRPHTVTAAAIAAAFTLLAGVSSAAAAQPAAPKPSERAAQGAVAPDAAAAARASRIAKKSSALGSYYDAASGEQVVVAGAGSSLSESVVDRVVGAPARLERRRISKSTVDAIKDEVAEREFSPSAEKYSYASYLDLETGKVVLKTDAPESVTDPLTEEFPGAIVRRDEAVRDMFDRRNDVPAFWGGSSIKSGGGVCTSGFTVQKPWGERFLTTAAHCFAVGASVLTTDGNRLVGTVKERGPLNSFWFWDNRDMELIGGQSYAGRIFVGGTTSSASKQVVGAGDPVPGFPGYCTSGQTSGERCGLTVQSTEAIVCTQTGCKWPVISYTGGPSQPGDSGAPMYIPGATGQVFARGTVIAGDGTTSYAEKWSRIASHFGVSIVS